MVEPVLKSLHWVYEPFCGSVDLPTHVVCRLVYNDDVVAFKMAAGKAVRAGLQHKGSDQDRAGSLVVRENQSRRDLTKVAQYEVLG